MKIKKRSSNRKKIISDKRIDALFFVIEWLIFIGFCVLATIFVKDVWIQYHAKETFMAQSLVPIRKLPTIVLCLESPFSNWIYGDGFIKIQVGNYTDYKTLKEHKTIHFEETDESYDLEQVSTECFKLNGSIKTGPEQIQFIRFVRVKIESKEIPDAMKVFFTSEENSYGIYRNSWLDGDVFEKILYPGHIAYINLKPVEYVYLEQEGHCSSKTFIEQWLPHLLAANFSSGKCPSPKRCSPFSYFVSNDIPSCGWGNDNAKSRGCANKALYNSYKTFRKKVGHKRPCHVLEYLGRTTFEKKSYAEKYFVFKMEFSPPNMITYYQERLVFDFIGMLGSIGGTLGMFIGFSFSGVISVLLTFTKTKLKCFF